MDYTKSNPLTLYFCGHEKCAPAHSFGPALRPHYLIHYILGGKGSYYEGGREHKLHKGDGFLILPGETTLYAADSIEPWEYCWIGFDGYEAKSILEHCGLTQNNLVFHSDEEELALSLLELNKQFGTRSGNSYTYLSQLYKIFSFMYRSACITSPQLSEDYLEQAISYISNNFVYDIRISDIANYVGIDRTYLYRLFIERNRISPQQFLIEYRLKYACKLIKETNLSITEIAVSSGFKDAPSMNKHFRKRYGMTPLQFRKLRA
jgi:AraC-like DNA-binding protein